MSIVHPPEGLDMSRKEIWILQFMSMSRLVMRDEVLLYPILQRIVHSPLAVYINSTTKRSNSLCRLPTRPKDLTCHGKKTEYEQVGHARRSATISYIAMHRPLPSYRLCKGQHKTLKRLTTNFNLFWLPARSRSRLVVCPERKRRVRARLGFVGKLPELR